MSILSFASSCHRRKKIKGRCSARAAVAGVLFASSFMPMPLARADDSVDGSRTEFASIYGENGRRIEVSDTRNQQSVADGLVRDTPKASALTFPLPVAKVSPEPAIDPSSPITLAFAGILIVGLVATGWVISRRRA